MDLIAMKASKARENFSEILDNADKRPVFISRKRDTYIVFPSHLMNNNDSLKIKISFGYDEKNGERVYFTKNDLFPDVIGWGSSKSEAIQSFTEDLAMLCQDFYNNFHIFSSLPGRQHQVLPVLKILSIIASAGNLSDLVEESKT